MSYFLLPDGGHLLLPDSGALLLPGLDDSTVYGGGGYYERIKQYREEKRLAELKLKQNEQEQRIREKELARIEAQRAEDMEDAELQRQLLVSARALDKLQQEHVKLLMAIEFFVRDEDDIAILLMASVN